MQTVAEFMICQDCAMIAANGEDGCEGTCDHGTGLAFHTALGDSVDFYRPFRPCPGCGTTLAGEWFHAVELA